MIRAETKVLLPTSMAAVFRRLLTESSANTASNNFGLAKMPWEAGEGERVRSLAVWMLSLSFSATGLKVSAEEITVYRDEWSASATAIQQVAGQDTAITWSIGYDSKGNLSWASGNSVIAVERGEFKTISAKSALKRLSDWRWFGSPANNAYPVSESSNKMGTLDMPAVSPAEPETVVVTINGSTKHLLQIWDKSGGAWLVPGYGLTGSNGSINFVVSLVEGVIELPEPIAMEPGIQEPAVDPMTK